MKSHLAHVVEALSDAHDEQMRRLPAVEFRKLPQQLRHA